VKIDGAHGDAENVGGNKSELLRLNANDTHDDAVAGRERPAFPTTASDQDGGHDG
jgi:hypothetical protein